MLLDVRGRYFRHSVAKVVLLVEERNVEVIVSLWFWLFRAE